MIGATLPQGVAWIVGTAVGALGGDFIGDPEKLGLDVIFPAFFLALLAEELREARAIAVALIAAVLALTLLPFVPPGVPVIAACVAALLGLRRSS
jgi:predicted branched-subunit amino acid permease